MWAPVRDREGTQGHDLFSVSKGRQQGEYVVTWWEWILIVYLAGFVIQTLTNWIWLLGPGRNRAVDAPEDYMFIAVWWPMAMFGFWTAPGRIGVHDGVEK